MHIAFQEAQNVAIKLPKTEEDMEIVLLMSIEEKMWVRTQGGNSLFIYSPIPQSSLAFSFDFKRES